MAKKGTRKSRSSRSSGFVSRVYSPVKHLINAAKGTVKEVSYYVGNVAGRTFKGVNRLGKVWVNEANGTIRNLTRKGGQRRKVMGGGGSRKSSKSRKGSRKSRKGSRKSRK
jgi:hypothetical protein